jgi:UDPglucose 6-dehydrogenase
MKVSVVGLGKLGVCIMAHIASNENVESVIGVDVNASTVKHVNANRAPVTEPGLQELLTINKGRYHATTTMKDIAQTDISFVVVPTPSNTKKKFSNEYIFQAVDAIGEALRKKEQPHTVVIVSTVMPGSTDGPIRERLERSSRRTDISLVYSPEFIALGSVIHDLQQPDMLLIGASDVEAVEKVEAVLNPYGKIPVALLAISEAEIAKLALNCYVTTKISFANMLGEVCERFGVDGANVTAAMGMDSRIGSKYLRPATAWGGPCFPRDDDAFIAFTNELGLPAPLAEATIAINERQVMRAVIQIDQCASANVSVLGMAYKPNTPVLERSFGIDLVRELLASGYAVTIYDPLAMSDLERIFKDSVYYASSAVEAYERTQVCYLAQACDEFRVLRNFEGKRIIDPWGVLE